MYVNYLREHEVTLGQAMDTATICRRFNVDPREAVEGDRLRLTMDGVITARSGYQNRENRGSIRIILPVRRLYVDGHIWQPFAGLITKGWSGRSFCMEAHNVATHAAGLLMVTANYGIVPVAVTFGGVPTLAVTEDMDAVTHLAFYANCVTTGFAGLHNFDHVKIGDIEIVLMPLMWALELIEAPRRSVVVNGRTMVLPVWHSGDDRNSDGSDDNDGNRVSSEDDT